MCGMGLVHRALEGLFARVHVDKAGKGLGCLIQNLHALKKLASIFVTITINLYYTKKKAGSDTMALLFRQIEIIFGPDGSLDYVVKAFPMKTPFGGYEAGSDAVGYFGAQHMVCLAVKCE